MAARGLVNGRSPLRRSGRDLVFRCYPPELLSPHKKTEADLLGQPLLFITLAGHHLDTGAVLTLSHSAISGERDGDNLL